MVKKDYSILMVDDEIKIIEVVKSFLESKGYRFFFAESGEQALEVFEREAVSLILLDLMLPDMSGEEICIKIRQRSQVPIIMLTAKVAEESMIQGFNIGADDYIIKPFSLKELQVRIEAVIRRAASNYAEAGQKYLWGGNDIEIDLESHLVKKKDQPVNLTPTEFNLLMTLVKYPNKVFTRNELIQIALGEEFDGYDRAIDNHIKNLRHKIEDHPKESKYVVTVHGVGYKFGPV